MWVYRIIICRITSVVSTVKHVDRQTEYPLPFMQRIKDMLNPAADFLFSTASRVFVFIQLLWAFASEV